MPFSGQRRVQGLQTVILTHCPASTIGTPSVSVRNCGLPLMPFTADPPGFLVRVWSDILWSQATVLFRMPLFGQLRVDHLQAVIASYCPSSTVWASIASASIADWSSAHSWPMLQSHQALLLEPEVTSLGVRGPFFVGCHSRARVGLSVYRQLSIQTLRPEQYGHPVLR